MVVYAGEGKFPITPGVEAMGLVEAMEILATQVG
jgi:hypothetical protein